MHSVSVIFPALALLLAASSSAVPVLRLRHDDGADADADADASATTVSAGGSNYSVSASDETWSDYLSGLQSTDNSTGTWTGVEVTPANIISLSQALVEANITTSVWVSSWNGDSYGSRDSNSTSCLVLEPSRAYFSVVGNCTDSDTGEPLKFKGLSIVPADNNSTETMVTVTDSFTIGDLEYTFTQGPAIPWSTYMNLTSHSQSQSSTESSDSSSQAPARAGITIHNLKQISSSLMSANVSKGTTLWIGSWNGDTYGDKACLALTLPEAVNALDDCDTPRPYLTSNGTNV